MKSAVKYSNYIKFIVLPIILLCMLSGCAKKEQSIGTAYNVYYLSENDDSVISVEYSTEETDTTLLVGELINQMLIIPERTAYHSAIDEKSGFFIATVSEGQVIIDFDTMIEEMPKYRVALIRAALTKTMTQIAGISSVSCTVNGQPMLDSNGVAIGPMNADTFIDNQGGPINPETQKTLTLYFASEDGNHLVAVKRNVKYSGNISMDKLILEQLITGPLDMESGYAVLDENVSLISVTTQDGTCYVNLSKDFLTSSSNINADVVIFSIVDSLVEIENVNKVQFLIDGDSNVYFREKYDLSIPLVRNLDLIE